MELPQPRTLGAEGRKTTHDFLSLYSAAQQDPRPSQGSYLKTHDFLQPLEGSGKNGASGENNLEVSAAEKPPPPTPSPHPSVTHILPGGIGTYSISYYEQREPRQEGSFSTVAQASSAERNDENSNCSSYSGSGFTLFEESAAKKGKTGKENIVGERHDIREASVNLEGGPWTMPLVRQSQSSSSHKLNSTALSALSSSQQPIIEKYPSFTKMLTSPKVAEEEDDEEFVVKKEVPSHIKDNLTVNVDRRSADQKPNTPRSKHSATEQRRRCKINDRFQRLREIIPHGDQKRDKASFLLEVIEYIQYLQEKADRYEGSHQGWNQEPLKLMTWGKSYRNGEGLIDQSQCKSSVSGHAMIFAAKMDDSKAGISPANTSNVQKSVDLLNTVVVPKERIQQPEFPNNAESKQPVFPFSGTSNAAATYSSELAFDINKPPPQHPRASFYPRTTDGAEISDLKLKEQEQKFIESGTISISSVYSQQLLNSLTQALEHSGVDLSQASVAVQIDLGKRANNGLYPSIPTSKVDARKADYKGGRGSHQPIINHDKRL
ncbi:hypothetical protein Leryth_023878 [Lithospermum erythrorhizon]|nr:hypothetical protein Leryth_023878 [Lithospermum erythrorhizon]